MLSLQRLDEHGKPDGQGVSAVFGVRSVSSLGAAKPELCELLPRLVDCYQENYGQAEDAPS